MIPKIIHYVWVGDKEKPQSVKNCIESWKKHCPDYKIVEWNNNILNDIDCLYVTQAINHKKWAFVSDYIRLFVLKRFGGIYLDTDVELKDSLDKFLNDDFFLGHENYHGCNRIFVGTAVIGAIKNQFIINDLLNEYNSLTFEKANGELNMIPNTCRFYDYFIKKFGIKANEGRKKVSLCKKCNLYPWWFFCLPKKNKKCYAIHHFNGSWLEAWKRKTKLRLHLGDHYISLVKFSKVMDTTDSFKLNKNEHLVFQFCKNSKKIYTLIRGKE